MNAVEPVRASAVEVRGVSVRYGAPVLDGVSVRAEAGEWVGVIGPNGAGKTTLLGVVAGFVGFEGEVLLDGAPSSRMRRRERSQRVALVPQRPLIPSGMTVAEYVLMGRTPHIRYLDVETPGDVRIVTSVLRDLGVERFADRPLGSLSGGEQQRIVLARALAQRAPVLLLDEGTNALDVGSQQEVLELVAARRAAGDLTVISAMHDLTLAGQFCDRLVMLDRGRVVAEGVPRDVLTEEAVAAHYGATVRVVEDSDGTIAVVPVRTRSTVSEVTIP